MENKNEIKNISFYNDDIIVNSFGKEEKLVDFVLNNSIDDKIIINLDNNYQYNFFIELINNIKNIFINLDKNNFEIIVKNKISFFRNETVLLDISFKLTSIKEKIDFKNCIFEEDIIFEYSTIIEDVKFNNCTFKKDLVFEKCEFEGKLEIIDCEIKGKLELDNINNLKYLNIKNEEKSKNNINKIYFKNFDTLSDDESYYFLYNLKLKQLFFDSFSNLSKKFVLGNLEVDKLYFKNAILGNLIFNTINIKNKLYLKNTALNDCIFNGVEFPKNYELEGWKLSNKQLKDNYRQLKFVMEKNGNLTEANKFFGREMEYYLKQISEIQIFKNGKPIFENILKYGSILGEKIVLGFSKVLNDFGNNWIINLIWLFIFVYLSSYIKFIYITNQYSEIKKGITDIYNSSEIYENIFVQFLYILGIFVFLYFISKWIIEIFSWIFEKTHIFSLIGVFISIYFLYGYKEIFNDFLNLLINPLYGFKDLLSQKLEGI